MKHGANTDRCFIGVPSVAENPEPRTLNPEPFGGPALASSLVPPYSYRKSCVKVTSRICRLSGS